MAGYNPYRQTNNNLLSNIPLDINNNNNNFFNNTLSRLSKFGRNYSETVIKNSRATNYNEDLTQLNDINGTVYSMFSRKVQALVTEKQKIAALSQDYISKINIFKEYAKKGEILDYVTKLTNDIIIYSKDKKFCELEDLPDTYSKIIKDKSKIIFENIYNRGGFNDGTLAWDICHDWLVEGFLCREIIYDSKGKNILAFQRLDPATIVPIIDPESGYKLWIQHFDDDQNRVVLLDSSIIYISYSGSSNYMETSYIEPLIKPYNELKSVERTRLLFNLINATMHKEFVIPTEGLSQSNAEQEMATLIADYKDHVMFDNTTGEIYIDGSKELPYSKEYWFPNSGEGRPEMSIIDPGGHDLNENTTLIWFKNNLKNASKFPLTRLDNTIGGGNIYSNGNEISHDDYNFTQYIDRLRSLFKDIILKPVIIQLILDFPELENNINIYNDINIEYFGHSELIKAKELSNMQAKSAIVTELQNGFKREDDKPYFHHDYLAKYVYELTDEQIALNNEYWKNSSSSVGGEAGDMSGGGDDMSGGGDMGGGDDMGAIDDMGGGDDMGATDDMSGGEDMGGGDDMGATDDMAPE